MTDQALLAKKLAQIETCVRELRTLAHLDALRSSVREQRFVEHTLQIAIQAALDAAAHIVSDERLGEPRTNRDLFVLLASNRWVPSRITETLRNMAGFRNILVHGYEDVDLQVVEDVVTHHLEDLEAFVQAIRERLARA